MDLVSREPPWRVQFEITHECNQNCPLCDHRIKFSRYRGMTPKDYGYIVSCLGPSRFRTADLIGGEPLVHPKFDWFAQRMLTDFESARVRVRTNGRLMPQVRERNPQLFDRLTWILQTYPGFNDEVVVAMVDLPNVKILKFEGFWNPYRDPDLDETTAREVRLKCNYHVRLVGTKLYNCCLANGIEQYYETDPVHVQITPNWREDWCKLETWKACQHCFRAIERFGGKVEGVPVDL